jgi:hypothetical protein
MHLRSRGLFNGGTTLLALGFSVALASGCDVAPTDGASDVVEAPGVDHVLGSLDLGYGDVSFHEVTLEDGSVLVGLSENAPSGFETTPVRTLIAEGHTSLEMWRALFPNQPAPDALVRRQPSEAAAIGRVNADVRVGKLDKDAQIPQSQAGCNSLAAANVFKQIPSDNCYDYSWINQRYSTGTSGNSWMGVIDNAGAKTLSNVTMGICNDSSVNITGRPLVKQGSSASYVPVYSWSTVKPGYLWYWYNFHSWSYDTCAAPTFPNGDPCLPLPQASAYRVEGSSPAGKTYYLYTGVLKSTIKPNCLR